MGERRSIGTGSAVALVLVACQLWSGAAAAHSTPPTVVRKIVRVQGYVGAAPRQAGAPGDEAIVRVAELTVLGEKRTLHATAWQIFRLDGEPDAPEPAKKPTLTLQGSRRLLLRVRDAQPDQRVTVLGERRPGSQDLFLLAVDLCPATSPAPAP